MWSHWGGCELTRIHTSSDQKHRPCELTCCVYACVVCDLGLHVYTSRVRLCACVYLCRRANVQLPRAVFAPMEGLPNMSCVICLSTGDAHLSCSCSARACPVCLLALLDRGVNPCVVCGSNFEPLAVVTACLHNVQNCGVSSGDLAKAHGKLAVAYSTAGRPRHALRSLAFAHLHAEPNSRWEQFLKFESAQNMLSIGETTEADRVSRSIMPTVLQEPTSKPGAELYAHCCLLKCKINAQRDKQGPAGSWLRRAIGVQSDFGLNAPLAASLQLHAELLNKEANTTRRSRLSRDRSASC